MTSVAGYTLQALSSAQALGILAAGSVVLILLHLLRERVQRRVVAFLPLWDVPAGGRHARWLGMRWRRLSFLLQWLILVCIVLGAAQPRRATPASRARAAVVLIDRSASMGARGATAATRLQEAAALLPGLTAALKAEGVEQLAFIAFAGESEVLRGLSRETEAPSALLAPLTPLPQAGRLRAALTFGAELLRGTPRPLIVVLTDGGDTAAAPAGVETRWVRVGTAAENVAVGAIALSRRHRAPSTVDGALLLRHHGSSPRRVRFQLGSGTHEVALQPGATHVWRFQGLPVGSDGQLEARLLDADALALDDRSYAVAPPARSRRVLVVGPPNFFLDAALDSLGAEITRLDLPAAETARSTWRSYDLVVFDGLTPSAPPDAGLFLYFGPSGPGSPFGVSGTTRAAVVTEMDRRHPITAQLSWADLNVREARRLVAAPGDEVLVSSFGTPLVLARKRGSLAIVAVAFDVRRSDLALRATFPLLLGNVLAWSARVAVDGPPLLFVGTSTTLQAAESLHRWTLPDGRALDLPSVQGQLTVTPTLPGFHRLTSGANVQTYAAIFDEPRESALSSPPQLGPQITPWEPRPSRVSTWSPGEWLLLFALALGVIEWMAFHRGWTA